MFRLFFLLICAFVIKSSYIVSAPLYVGAWFPYWSSDGASQAIRKHLKRFDELSPFSYEINSVGKPISPFHKKKQHWRSVFAYCRRHQIPLIPTVAWFDSSAMHKVLSNPVKRKKHIDDLIHLVEQDHLQGLNIDYEHIDPADRKYFLDFLEVLSARLHKKGLKCCCTIGARTSDTTVHYILPGNISTDDSDNTSIPVSLSPGTGDEARRYKRVLARCCDHICIMGYDEWGKTYSYNAANLRNKYYLSHSSLQWLEQVIAYAVSFLPPEKILLGLPTYGLDFIIKLKENNSIDYKKYKAVTFPEAQLLAKEYQRKPRITAGGERSFTYKLNGEEHYVCYLDAKAIMDRALLAKKYKLKGIYLFKLDGNEDSLLWNYLPCKK